jgi:hypothetical protein
LLVPGAFLPINKLHFTIGLGWDFSKKTGCTYIYHVLVYELTV